MASSAARRRANTLSEHNARANWTRGPVFQAPCVCAQSLLLVIADFAIPAAIGFNVETVTYKNLKFQVWDLGGQTSIRPYVSPPLRSPNLAPNQAWCKQTNTHNSRVTLGLCTNPQVLAVLLLEHGCHHLRGGLC